ncbi:TPA: hypothetical protein DF272_06555 [Candidatus Falkowbacteria bacterium]|nr:hypothetical protein [Candidatus Falkowbacteria bacterium]
MTQLSKAIFVGCIDPRYQVAFHEFLVRRDLFGHHDPVQLAGGPKIFLVERSRDLALDQVHIAIYEHGVTEVYLMAHWDCLAYGGSKNFASKELERQRYEFDLADVKALILSHFPMVTIYEFIAVKDPDSFMVEFIHIQ